MTSSDAERSADAYNDESEGGAAASTVPYLSVIIPAFNEEERLPSTLDIVCQFLTRQRYDWEVIVVDDGSDDHTARVAIELEGHASRKRVIRQRHLGKAAAVRSGVAAARGDNILFTDADLSTPIESLDLLLAQRERGFDVVIGSREGAASRRIDEPRYRHLMGRAFNLIVQVIALRGIKDTQCGFKLFSRDSAERIFPRLLVNQAGASVSGPRVSAFDVEVLFLARRNGFRIAEVPVVWTHARGSKVRPAIDSVRMFIDVLAVRWNALRGKYN